MAFGDVKILAKTNWWKVFKLYYLPFILLALAWWLFSPLKVSDVISLRNLLKSSALGFPPLIGLSCLVLWILFVVASTLNETFSGSRHIWIRGDVLFLGLFPICKLQEISTEGPRLKRIAMGFTLILRLKDGRLKRLPLGISDYDEKTIMSELSRSVT